jgi:hypothetical protein
MANETVEYVRVQVIVEARVSGLDGSRLVVPYNREWYFTEGTGSLQVGQAWYDASRTLATTSEDLDLNGTLAAFNGGTVDLNNIKIMVLENLDTDTGDHLFLKQGSAQPCATVLGGTTPTLKVGPGGAAILINPTDGYVLGAGASDTLAVETVDNSSYKVIVVGDNA